MLKVKDIAKAIEDFAPLSLKEDWDNPGLQVGDREVFYGFCYVLYFKHLISHYALYVNP